MPDPVYASGTCRISRWVRDKKNTFHIALHQSKTTCWTTIDWATSMATAGVARQREQSSDPVVFTLTDQLAKEMRARGVKSQIYHSFFCWSGQNDWMPGRMGQKFIPCAIIWDKVCTDVLELARAVQGSSHLLWWSRLATTNCWWDAAWLAMTKERLWRGQGRPLGKKKQLSRPWEGSSFSSRTRYSIRRCKKTYPAA